MNRLYLVMSEPEALTFDTSLDHLFKSTLQLKNKATHAVAFQIKTNSATKYLIKPGTGILGPSGDIVVEFSLLPDQVPEDNDRFLIQAAPTTLPPASSSSEIKLDLAEAPKASKQIAKLAARVINSAKRFSTELSHLSSEWQTEELKISVEELEEELRKSQQHLQKLQERDKELADAIKKCEELRNEKQAERPGAFTSEHLFIAFLTGLLLMALFAN